jgi:hypothetical protein
VEESTAPPIPDQPTPKGQDGAADSSGPPNRSVASSTPKHPGKDAKHDEHDNRARHTTALPPAHVDGSEQTALQQPVAPPPVVPADSTAADPTTTTVADPATTPAASPVPAPGNGVQDHGNGGSGRPRREQGDRGSGKRK